MSPVLFSLWGRRAGPGSSALGCKVTWWVSDGAGERCRNPDSVPSFSLLNCMRALPVSQSVPHRQIFEHRHLADMRSRRISLTVETIMKHRMMFTGLSRVAVCTLQACDQGLNPVVLVLRYRDLSMGPESESQSWEEFLCVSHLVQILSTWHRCFLSSLSLADFTGRSFSQIFPLGP